ncbi:MAG: DUF4412 domain-containing protein, partial [Gammaproteobacteria bacterium]|nr:DUF4412 domain-containing protein [Gammaproteobacteria bacterium]
QTLTTIRRDDLGKMWMLMPDEHMYMEISAGQQNASGMKAESPADFKTEMTEVGPEMLDGIATTKHKVIMTDADGTKMGGFWWTTAEGIPVKMDMLAIDQGDKIRLKQQLSNIVLGEPDPALFEIPPGYESMMSMGIESAMPSIPGAETIKNLPGIKSIFNND